MESIVDFVKWCFRDDNSGMVTIIVLGIIFQGTIGIILAIKAID